MARFSLVSAKCLGTETSLLLLDVWIGTVLKTVVYLKTGKILTYGDELRITAPERKLVSRLIPDELIESRSPIS